MKIFRFWSLRIWWKNDDDDEYQVGSTNGTNNNTDYHDKINTSDEHRENVKSIIMATPKTWHNNYTICDNDNCDKNNHEHCNEDQHHFIKKIKIDIASKGKPMKIIKKIKAGR